MYKKLALQSLLSLFVTLIVSILSGFASMSVLGYLFKPVMDGIADNHGKAAAQNLMLLVSLGLFLLIMSLIAYRRGKRRTRKEKFEEMFFLKFTSAAAAAYVIPALVLFSMRDPFTNVELHLFYYPFISFFNFMKITQLSIVITAFLTVIMQTGSYYLGKILWRKQKEREEW